jgi:hypothetical protein
MAPKLDTFTSSSLTLKATYNIDNPNEAVELYEEDKLTSVLRRFKIEETNVKVLSQSIFFCPLLLRSVSICNIKTF